MIKKTVLLSSSWPNETGKQIILKLEKAFPSEEIVEREYQEKDSVFMMPILLLHCSYLELPVHFEYNGAELSYTLFGLSQNQLDSHPKLEQITIWVNEQILKFKNISSK